MVRMHFLNVGKGSCTILEVQSGIGMIDIDNSRVDGDDSLTDPLEYVKGLLPSGRLFRFVLTHPDMDHMSGLHQLSKQISILNFWDTANTKTLEDSSWAGSPYDKRDWETYQRLRGRTEDPKSLRLLSGATSECCWVQDGITVLAPTEKLVKLANETEEYNHLSYALRLDHGGTGILFGGDATPEAWEEIARLRGAESLKAKIFLAPHHGSASNVHKDVFKLVSPSYVIVSVAEGVDYDYDYYAGLAQKQVLSTKAYGNLEAHIQDDGSYTIYYQHEP
jgi:beta-lactamase superfamily II metal-dependent hydrolase